MIITAEEKRKSMCILEKIMEEIAAEKYRTFIWTEIGFLSDTKSRLEELGYKVVSSSNYPYRYRISWY